MAESPSELQTEIEKLEARHAEHPEGRFFVPLANAYRKAGEVARAEAVLREGLRRHPDYLSAHIVLGRCLADRGAVAEATEEFQHVLSIDPQNLIALRTLGDLALSAGQPAESARWYEQLLAVDPMNEDARRALESIVGAESGAGAEPDAPTLPATEEELYGGFLDLSEEPADGDAAGPGLEVGGEVVTETIAELYARQGLHDRAAEVYRELIRRRGGDPGLERRLAELTAPPPMVEPTTPPLEAPVAEEPSLPEPVEATPESLPFDEPLPILGDLGALPEAVDDDATLIDPDPFASSFEYGFLDEPPPAEPEPEQEQEQEQEQEPAPRVEWAEPPVAPPVAEPEPLAVRASSTIAAYLSDLAAWRPGTTPPAAAAFATPEPAPEPGTPAAEAPEPEALEPVDEYEAPRPVDEINAPEPIEPDLTEPEPVEEIEFVAPEPVEPGLTTPDPVADIDLEVAEPWVSRASVADSSEAAPAPAVPPAEEEPLFPWEMGSDAATLPAPEPAPAPAPPAAPAGQAQEEDDDLESFQAWLRSLRR